MNMTMMNTEQIELLLKIHSLGVLEFDHRTMEFSLDEMSIYDFNYVYAFLSETEKDDHTKLYQLSPRAIQHLKQRGIIG